MDLAKYEFPEVTKIDLTFPTFDAPKGLVEEAERRNPEKGIAKFNELFYSGGNIELQKDVKDPFKEIKIDTVKVVDIKNGYIKWEYKDGHCLSNKVNAFKKCKRQLN